jgi:hypothetical protein
MKFALLAGLAATALAACSTTLQTYSSAQHETLRLEAHELREGGLAFLTPSAVTGREEDTQALAHVFAATLRSERPDLRVVALPYTLSEVNRAGLAGTYRGMYQDYRDTGVFDAAALRRVADAAGVRFLAQIKLAEVHQGARGRLNLLGLSLLQTHYANLRVLLQVWDSRDGSIAWEGLDEVTFAIDSQRERPITFRAIAAHAAKDLIMRLP